MKLKNLIKKALKNLKINEEEFNKIIENLNNLIESII